MNDDQWYFAYGSNLDIDQKQARTKGIRQAVRCRLRGYRLACNKRGRNGDVYANIVPDAAAEVWGVIYLCCPDALRKMDRREGVETGDYKRAMVEVETDAGETVEAVAYVAGEEFVCEDGKPSEGYLGKILSGARHHGLPEDYVRQIESLGR